MLASATFPIIVVTPNLASWINVKVALEKVITSPAYKCPFKGWTFNKTPLPIFAVPVATTLVVPVKASDKFPNTL